MKFSWFKLDTGKLDTVVRSVFSLVGQGFGPVCVGASAKRLGGKSVGTKWGNTRTKKTFFCFGNVFAWSAKS